MHRPADVEHRQHGEHVVAAGEVLVQRRVDDVPEQRGLRVHRALRLPRGAGGVDDQHRIGVGAGQLRLEPGRHRTFPREPAGGRAAQGDEAHQRPVLADRSGGLVEVGLDDEHRRFGVREDVCVLGAREAEVERHQDRAEPRAREEQDEDFGMVVAEVRDAIAPIQAEAREPQRRGVHAPPERRPGDVLAGEVHGDPVGPDLRPVRDDAGEVHGRN